VRTATGGGLTCLTFDAIVTGVTGRDRDRSDRM